ncbi:hypothetical protein G9A89_002940, partial [Geosiphon pyriformis]
FDDIQLFTFGLEFSYLGSGVIVIMNINLAKHVCKVSKIANKLLSIKLLFRNKLSILILEFYAGTTLAVHLS